jgi:CBS domain-containing protein
MTTPVPERLREVADEIRKDGEQPRTTVRTLLGWFGAQRRGFYIVNNIRQALAALDLRTVPDFEGAFIDSEVRFISVDDIEAEAAEAIATAQGSSSASANAVTMDTATAVSFVSGAVQDPSFRIGKLDSANHVPVSVRPDSNVQEATTLMLIHDYSQLPVMQNERDVKGVVSWRSIGKRSALGGPCSTVRDCMDLSVPEVFADLSLFSAIGLIVEHGYVLVRQRDRRVSGIITTSDLSLQFLQLAEPFLLVGEIENYVRRVIDGKFTAEQLTTVRGPNDQREIESVADLDFGGYIRLLENPANWSRLDLCIDRGVLIRRLDRIRQLRNEVMHFNPDPFSAEDLEALRSFAGFMRDLVPR